jgi:hypothetical protein
MNCALCSRPAGSGVLVGVLDDTVMVCRECAARVAESERQAMLPLVTAGLAAFLAAWPQEPEDRSGSSMARQFWADLEHFGGVADRLEVPAALQALVEWAPRSLRVISD